MPGSPPETLVLLMMIAFVIGLALVIAVTIFVDSRFRRSRTRRLAHEQPKPPFSSPAAEGNWARGFLVAILVLSVVSIISGILEIELYSRLIRGYGYELAEVPQASLRQSLIGLLQSLLYMGTAVPFLIWFHRAHKNLPSLGQTGLAFTPGWAVGLFFVPFLSLVRPFQAMREVWRGSDPGRVETGVDSDGPVPASAPRTAALVGWWWAFFLMMNLGSGMASRIYLYAASTQSFPALRAASVLMIGCDLLFILGALVTIRLVGRLTRWQVEKARLISQQSGQAAAAVAAGPE